MQIADAKVGRNVTYTPFDGCDKSLKEYGIITSFNDTNIFVRYGDELQSKATSPMDLQYG